MPRSSEQRPILTDAPIKTGPPPTLSGPVEEQNNRRIEKDTNINLGDVVKVKVGYYLDPELAHSMRQVALDQRRRVSAVVEDAMRLYLQQNHKRKNSSQDE